ncbi:3-hydroxyacyl-CoA dehydrogenase family protein [Fictibacillus phosphorivorans]|uniref:3-hydroxyacyl-CoA dehydrogenase family protein n=1 Tax=Fictibacillus phosphorivorans TaxID=1221500 RepID=UPI0035E510F7
MIKNIVVIGAGQMGTGIAQTIASNKYNVTLIDYKNQNINRSKQVINNNLEKKIKKNKISKIEKNEILNYLSFSTEFQMIEDADLIIEAVTENISIKKELYKEISKYLNEKKILATNTSSYSVSELASYTNYPEKFIGIHFFNPVSSMPLVEIVNGILTDKEVELRVRGFLNAIGKSSIFVNDSPGFIVNRLLIPMINEAIFLHQEGIATKEEIDTSMKLGANHPMGPLSLADFIGLDTCLAIMETLHEDLGEDKYRPAPLLKKYVKSGLLGRKNGTGFFTYN